MFSSSNLLTFFRPFLKGMGVVALSIVPVLAALEADFSTGSLPAELSGGGGEGAEQFVDGNPPRLHIKTGAQNWARSYVRTGNAAGGTGAGGARTYAFSLDSWSQGSDKDHITFYLVGNHQGALDADGPDYRLPNVMGLTLRRAADGAGYELVFSGKAGAPNSGFLQPWLVVGQPLRLASPPARAGFTIEDDAGNITVFADGQTAKGVLKPALLQGFDKTAALYLCVTNSDSGQPAAFSFSSVTLGGAGAVAPMSPPVASAKKPAVAAAEPGANPPSWADSSATRVILKEPPFKTPIFKQKPWEAVVDWPAKWLSAPQHWKQPWAAVFQCEFEVGSTITDRIHVSADERYELFLDGKRLGRGPERGDPRQWSYESWDVNLAPGRHVLTARVWAMAPQQPWAQMSVRPGFFLCPESDALIPLIATGKPSALWRVRRMDEYAFEDPGKAAGSAMGVGPFERVDAGKMDGAWPSGGASAARWSAASAGEPGVHGGTAYYSAPQNDRHWLVPAQLPPMERGRWEKFSVVGATDAEAWQALLTRGKPLVVPARSAARVLIDFDDYLCAYPEIVWTGGGDGAEISLAWAETLRDGGGAKKRLSPSPADKLAGPADRLSLTGVAGGCWSPLWWRAGRFAELTVKTAEQPLTLERVSFEETRYPLEALSRWNTGNPQWDALFALCLRTLQVCAHETYVDCPFYEQLMYVGDARIQALAGYALSPDRRLQRKSIGLLDSSRMLNPAGMTTGVHPARGGKYLPPYALWWISMLNDYARWTDDPAFVREQMAGARALIEIFSKHVGENGVLRTPAGWSFYGPGFDDTVPPGGRRGGQSAVLNLQWILSLRQAAELEDYLGERELAARDRRLADQAQSALFQYFWDAQTGLLADDTAHDSYSEAAQILGLLAGVYTPPQAARAMEALSTEAAQADAKGLPKLRRTGSWFVHYLFEAAFANGREDWFFERLGPWTDLARSGFKTTPESFGGTRSEAHAWNAHPLYYYLTAVVGIRPEGLGGRRVVIAPHLGPLDSASATLAHPKGNIAVDVRKTARGVRVDIDLPEGVEGRVVLAGKSYPLRAGRQSVSSP